MNLKATISPKLYINTSVSSNIDHLVKGCNEHKTLNQHYLQLVSSSTQGQAIYMGSYEIGRDGHKKVIKAEKTIKK